MSTFETPCEHVRTAFLDMTDLGMVVDRSFKDVATTLLEEYQTWSFKYKHEIHKIMDNLCAIGFKTTDTILHTMRQAQNPYSEQDTRFVYLMFSNRLEEAERHVRSIFIDDYIGEEMLNSMCQRALMDEEPENE